MKLTKDNIEDIIHDAVTSVSDCTPRFDTTNASASTSSLELQVYNGRVTDITLGEIDDIDLDSIDEGDFVCDPSDIAQAILDCDWEFEGSVRMLPDRYSTAAEMMQTDLADIIGRYLHGCVIIKMGDDNMLTAVSPNIVASNSASAIMEELYQREQQLKDNNQ